MSRSFSRGELRVDPDGARPVVRLVTDGYTKTMGIRLVAGSRFLPEDDGDGVRAMIVNGTMAACLWPGRNPIGQVTQTGGQPALRASRTDPVAVLRSA